MAAMADSRGLLPHTLSQMASERNWNIVI